MFKKLFISFLTAILIINIVPFFNILADSKYYTFNKPCDNIGYFLYQNNANDPDYFQYYINNSSSDVRVLYYQINSSTSDVFFISENPFKYNSTNSDTIPCRLSSASNNAYSTTYNNTQYYYLKVPINRNTYPGLTLYIPSYSLYGNLNELNSAIYYSFGEGSNSNNEPEITYGSLDLGFSTSIAYSGGNQNAWRLNKDTFYFGKYDTLGNDLSDYYIELQAVPFSASAETNSDWLGMTINDYLFDTVRIGQLGYWDPGQTVDFTWEFVANRFNTMWNQNYGDGKWSILGWMNEQVYYKIGWAYRARCVDEEENVIIDWQWIYNASSVDNNDSNTILNNNGLTPDLVQSINNINTTNNTTNNNYYNNTTITYENPNGSDSEWWEDLLQFIYNVVDKILDAIIGFFSDLIDAIFGLIENLGIDFLGLFSNILNGIVDFFSNLDLTGINFTLPSAFSDLISSLGGSTNGILNVWFNNGLGVFIMIPLVIWLIGVVL